jgi:hypothetical protein
VCFEFVNGQLLAHNGIDGELTPRSLTSHPDPQPMYYITLDIPTPRYHLIYVLFVDTGNSLGLEERV